MSEYTTVSFDDFVTAFANKQTTLLVPGGDDCLPDHGIIDEDGEFVAYIPRTEGDA